MRPTILVPLKDHQEIQRIYFEKNGEDGLFVQGAFTFPVGTEVDLELRFASESKRFRVRGEIKWNQAEKTTPPVPSGIGVIFKPTDSAPRQLLLDFAMGKEVTLTHRADRRFGIQLPVKTSTPAESLQARTDDISTQGALIHTDHPLPVGTIFDVVLRFPGHLFSSSLKAKVIWHRNEEPLGMGVQFQYDSRKQEEQMEKLINQLKTKMMAQQQVRVPRLS